MIAAAAFPKFARGEFADLPGRKALVPGNHDHHLWELSREQAAEKFLRSGAPLAEAPERSAVLLDLDGVLAIPRAAEAEVLRLALEKARGEKAVGKAIAGGMSASEAWRKFGIM